MEDLNSNIFGSKKYSDLLEEIYNNQKKKDKQINELIKQLQPLVENLGDATLIVPLIAEYLDISVKNDDILIKMANVITKFLKTKADKPGGDMVLSAEEKEQLLGEIKAIDKKSKS